MDQAKLNWQIRASRRGYTAVIVEDAATWGVALPFHLVIKGPNYWSYEANCVTLDDAMIDAEVEISLALAEDE